MSVTGTVAMSVARIVTGIFRLIGLPGMVGICVWLFFVGIPLLDWWPVNRIPGIGTLVEGEISRRIDAHEREQALRAQARAHEAERVLGEREAIRAVQMRRQADKDAQARIGFANAQAAERERFLRQRDAENGNAWKNWPQNWPNHLPKPHLLQTQMTGLEMLRPLSRPVNLSVNRHANKR